MHYRNSKRIAPYLLQGTQRFTIDLSLPDDLFFVRISDIGGTQIGRVQLACLWFARFPDGFAEYSSTLRFDLNRDDLMSTFT